jgi:hypothetical protein
MPGPGSGSGWGGERGGGGRIKINEKIKKKKKRTGCVLRILRKQELQCIAVNGIKWFSPHRGQIGPIMAIYNCI